MISQLNADLIMYVASFNNLSEVVTMNDVSKDIHNSLKIKMNCIKIKQLPYKILKIHSSVCIKYSLVYSYKFKDDSFTIFHYISDLSEVLDMIILNNNNNNKNNIYSNKSINKHQSLRQPTNSLLHDHTPNKKFVYCNLHQVMNITKNTYNFLRRKHFNVLGLIY